MARRAVDREIGEDLADDRAELVAVAREPGADDRAPAVSGCRSMRKCSSGDGSKRQVLSAIVGPAPSGKYRSANARSGRSSSSVGSREIVVGVSAGAEVVVAAELEARDPERREAVEVLAVEHEVEDGHPLGREDLRAARLEPGERLAHSAHEPVGQARDVLRPRARGEDDALGLDHAAIGA